MLLNVLNHVVCLKKTYFIWRKFSPVFSYKWKVLFVKWYVLFPFHFVFGRLHKFHLAIPIASYPVATYLFLFALEYGKAINARKAFWEGEREKVPSLDAPRTHQILPINHSADKGSDWVRDCHSHLFCSTWLKILTGFTIKKKNAPARKLFVTP